MRMRDVGSDAELGGFGDLVLTFSFYLNLNVYTCLLHLHINLIMFDSFSFPLHACEKNLPDFVLGLEKI